MRKNITASSGVRCSHLAYVADFEQIAEKSAAAGAGEFSKGREIFRTEMKIVATILRHLETFLISAEKEMPGVSAEMETSGKAAASVGAGGNIAEKRAGIAATETRNDSNNKDTGGRCG